MMKNVRFYNYLFYIPFLYFFILCFMLTAHGTSTSAVTYNLSGGRFGDNLISYCHAKWFSYKHKVPLVYKPFNFADQLQISLNEKNLDYFPKNYFKKAIVLHRYDPNMMIEHNTLYVLPNFPEAELERESFKYNNFKQFLVDWNDTQFKAELRKNIAPINKCVLVSLPDNILTVALHVRKNSNGFDGQLWYHNPKFSHVQGHINPELQDWRAKFVPDKYYVAQLKRLSKMLGHPPLYVFVFTDDQSPVAIMNNLKKQANLPNLQFDCRREHHDHTIHILEDFFSMAQCDFLIRADSYFSLACAKIANFKIELAPTIAEQTSIYEF